jgi:5,10-methylenetetrahydrofolate reductase
LFLFFRFVRNCNDLCIECPIIPGYLPIQNMASFQKVQGRERETDRQRGRERQREAERGRERQRESARERETRTNIER